MSLVHATPLLYSVSQLLRPRLSGGVTDQFSEQAKLSNCPQRGCAEQHESRHEERLERREPSTARGAREAVKVSHGRMLSDDFSRRRSAKGNSAAAVKGRSVINWLDSCKELNAWSHSDHFF